MTFSLDLVYFQTAACMTKLEFVHLLENYNHKQSIH